LGRNFEYACFAKINRFWQNAHTFGKMFFEIRSSSAPTLFFSSTTRTTRFFFKFSINRYSSFSNFSTSFYALFRLFSTARFPIFGVKPKRRAAITAQSYNLLENV